MRFFSRGFLDVVCEVLPQLLGIADQVFLHVREKLKPHNPEQFLVLVALIDANTETLLSKLCIPFGESVDLCLAIRTPLVREVNHLFFQSFGR